MATRAKAAIETNEGHESVVPKQIPPEFKLIRPEAKILKDGAVHWGWKEWRVIAKPAAKHLKAHGRTGFAAALVKAQKALPKELRRSTTSLGACLAPTASLNVERLIHFIDGQQAEPPKLQLVKGSKRNPDDITIADFAREQGIKSKGTIYREVSTGRLQTYIVGVNRFVTRAAVDAWLAARTKPYRPRAPRPVPAEPYVPAATGAVKRRGADDKDAPQVPEQAVERAPAADPLVAFLATPVGALLPLVQGMLDRAFQVKADALEARLTATLTAKLVELIGAPVETKPDTPETVAAKVETAKEVAVQFLGLTRPDADHASDLADALQEPAAAAAAEDAPHDMASQMARALGIKYDDGHVPKSMRKCVVVVGVHPKVAQEVEHKHGEHYRFEFKNCDDFNGSKDLPASTDLVLLYKKKLTKEMQAVLRRRNVQALGIVNQASAIAAAAHKVFS